jgi:hypothetical protein
MAVDLHEQLVGQLTVIAQQGIADNQRLSMESLLAFQKDLFQGAQGEIAAILASINASERTPVVK